MVTGERGVIGWNAVPLVEQVKKSGLERARTQSPWTEDGHAQELSPNHESVTSLPVSVSREVTYIHYEVVVVGMRVCPFVSWSVGCS